MQYKLYIPTNCLNKIIYVAGQKVRLDVYMSSYLNVYGGYTMYTARGSFIDKNKMTIIEDVTIYELIVMNDNSVQSKLEHLLRYIKKQLNEESMLMWCGGGEGVWV